MVAEEVREAIALDQGSPYQAASLLASAQAVQELLDLEIMEALLLSVAYPHRGAAVEDIQLQMQMLVAVAEEEESKALLHPMEGLAILADIHPLKVMLVATLLHLYAELAEVLLAQVLGILQALAQVMPSTALQQLTLL
jgi:hypothetical protein